MTIERYSALAAIIFVWVIVAAGMSHTHLGVLDTRPISYLGTSDYAPYFRTGLLVGLVAMGTFYIYLARTFKPTPSFRNLYFTGLAMQLIVAFAPYQVNGNPQWLHWTAAIILAFALVFAPWVFAGSRNISRTTGHISRAVTLGYLAALVIETFLLATFGYYAPSELFNLVIFHAWIIYLTFAKPEHNDIA